MGARNKTLAAVTLHAPRLIVSVALAGWVSSMALWPDSAAAEAPPSSHDSAAPAANLPPPGWSSNEIEIELARCTQALRGVDVVVRRLPPLREHECGAAAPVELISAAKVAFSPPVTITCDLAAALARWIKADVQPLARKHLGSEIVRIETMSSYSCRTAYGRKNSRLSEHGKANAVDLRSFTTAKGLTSEVLADWGPTGREIAAQVVAAQREDAARLAHAQKEPVTTGTIPRPAHEPQIWSRPAIATGPAGQPGAIFSLPEPPNSGIGFATGMGGGSRLGGPKPDDVNPAANPAVSALKTQFLRAAHDSACRMFGTTLGPEANSAHRNHFHVDMAERQIRSICE